MEKKATNYLTIAIGIIAVLVIGAGLYFLVGQNGGILGSNQGDPQEGQESEFLIPVETTTVARHNLSSYLETVGELRAGDTATVSPKVSGRVASVNAKVGDRVTKGQILITIDDKDATQLVEAAETQLEAALTEIEIHVQNVSEAEKNFERAGILYEAEALSQVEYDRAEFTLTSANLGLKGAQIRVSSAELSLNNALEALTNFSVAAPLTGEVSAVNISSGEMATAFMPLINIVSLNPMKVRVNVSENIVGFLRSGDRITLNVPAINQEVFGRVTSISPIIDPVSKSFPVEISVDNPRGSMKAGMVVTLFLPSGSANNVVALPTDAILEKGGIKYVFVLEDNTARELAISTGFMSNTMSEITSGLSEGQRVITKGNQLLKDGQKVSVGTGIELMTEEQN